MGTFLRRRLRGQKGFTLLELMIVVNIIGILTLIALPAYTSMRGRAEDSANKANVRNALILIDAYYQDNETYSGMSLAALRTAYDVSFDVSRYALVSVSDTTYCIQSPASATTHVWRKNGPGALFENAHC